LTKGKQNLDFLEFLDGLPYADESMNSIYIRDCYATIAEEILARNKNATITGTPGIGKSLFLFYLLFKLVQAKQRVIFHYSDDIIYYDAEQNVFEAVKAGNFKMIKGFYDTPVWCLFDGFNKKASHIDKYRYCKLVISTSPRRDLVNDAKKESETYYMPIWTMLELERIAPIYKDINDWRERTLLIGGIPRYVFEKKVNDFAERIKSAVKNSDLEKCLANIYLETVASSQITYVHLLIHMQSVEPYTRCTMQFASEFVEESLYQHHTVKSRYKMQSLLESCRDDFYLEEFSTIT
jgi:hypothetical protein